MSLLRHQGATQDHMHNVSKYLTIELKNILLTRNDKIMKVLGLVGLYV